MSILNQWGNSIPKNKLPLKGYEKIILAFLTMLLFLATLYGSLKIAYLILTIN
jgi:hypothetical protein